MGLVLVIEAITVTIENGEKGSMYVYIIMGIVHILNVIRIS